MGKTVSHNAATAFQNEAQAKSQQLLLALGSITSMISHAVFVNDVSNCQYFQYVVVYNFTTIHAMSHRY
jgi:hypothetical protein